MDWKSLDEIIKEFKLTSGLNDLKGLNRELVSILVELHPDKTGGSFPSQETEKKYHRVSSAIEFISSLSQDSKALIPISELPAIIKAILQAQILPKQTQISQFRKEIREENREVLRASYTLPRIGSSVFASICLGLFTFSGALQTHPILGPILDNSVSQIMLLVLSVYAGSFFLFTWFTERKQEAVIEFLLSEAGLREIVGELLEKGNRFALGDVLNSIHGYIKLRYRLSPLGLLSILSGRSGIRSSVAEKIANMHLLELENRGAIHRLDIPSIDPIYQVDDNLNS